MNNCAQGYGCGNPVLTIDPYLPAGNRYVDVSAGGPNAFTFTATSNASWLHVSKTKGSISTNNPEERLFLGVDWSSVTGVQSAVVTINSTTEDKATLSVPVTITANHTVIPEGFSGMLAFVFEKAMGLGTQLTPSFSIQASSRATERCPLKQHTHPGTRPSRASPGLRYLAWDAQSRV